MSSSRVVADLEGMLTVMAAGKAPGVSASKISSITSHCVTNVQSESVLIQKIYTHFKKTPATHRLGVLYAVDSVVRKWFELAKAQGQIVDSAAPDGTYAAGVNRVTGLMPGLINDMTAAAPQEHKEKVKKLIDIWERVQLLSEAMITEFRQKLNNSPPQPISAAESTTPPGSPPRNRHLGFSAASSVQVPARASPHPPSGTHTSPEISSVLNALSKFANQPGTTSAAPQSMPMPMPMSMPMPPPPPPPAPQAHPSLSQVLGQLAPSTPQNGDDTHSQPYYQQQQEQQQQQQQQPVGSAPPVSPQSARYPAVAATQPGIVSHPYMQQGPISGAPSAPYMNSQGQPPMPSNVLGAAGLPALDPAMQSQVMLIKALVEQGIPQDKIPAIVASIAGAAAPLAQALTPQYGSTPTSYPLAPQHDSKDHSHVRGRSPQSHQSRGGRSRSRSPGRDWNGQDGVFSSRPREACGPFGGDAGTGPRSPHGRRLNDDRRDYRERSPPRRGSSPAPDAHLGPATTKGPAGMLIPAPESVPKLVEYDPNLGTGNIRVFSRTLFVGGVTCTETDLTEIFARYGYVQSCIVNTDKRHAFVKMVTRDHAEAAKKGLGDPKTRDGIALPGLPFRQCRWGVGYGPRDCSDYATGISVIPINRLTDADKRWMLSAEYGGSGGKEITQGLVVEEPDIEIGAGVSSKAISKRVGGEKGGHTTAPSAGGFQKKGKFERKGAKYEEDGGGRGGWVQTTKDREHVYNGRGGGSRDMANPNNMPVADRRTSGGGSNNTGNTNVGSMSSGNMNAGNPSASGPGRNRSGEPQPEVEGFPFGLTAWPNGMPKLPPGFRFPAPDPGQ